MGNGRRDPPFPTGSSVPFPYESPYPQQEDLMDTLLSALKLKAEVNDNMDEASSRASLLLLESPTGTGKSLSLACASLAWLFHTEEMDLNKVIQDAPAKATSSEITKSGIDWLDNWVPPEQRQAKEDLQSSQRIATEARDSLNQELSALRRRLTSTDDSAQTNKRLNLLRSAITTARMQSRQTNGKGARKRKRVVTPTKSAQLEDYCLEAYRSDDDHDERSLPKPKPKLAMSEAGRLLDGARLDGSFYSTSEIDRQGLEPISPYSSKPLRSQTVGDVQPGSGVRKIVYAARTHSQLSQFVSEIRRTVWGKTVRVVALGGRKTLCGNASVRSKPEAALTEACLDLQKSSSCNCPLLKNKDSIDILALHNLATPTDIEEAAQMGQQVQTCAYYASRKALAAAQVVVLPYSMLLSEETRQSVGLSLEQNLVIVDEAHNLPESLRSLHSCRLTLTVIRAALDQLSCYTAKYAQVLAGRNIHYLGQIRKTLLAMKKHLERPKKDLVGRMLHPEELLIGLKLDNVNLYKILRYLKRSQLSRKLLGFRNFSQPSKEPGDELIHDIETPADGGGLSKHVSAMSIVESFLQKMSLTDRQGMITTDIVDPEKTALDVRGTSRTQPALRYALLHPNGFFSNVIDQAHALALVGGTLRPFVHVAAELLKGPDDIQKALQADQSATQREQNSRSFATISTGLTAFSCDHVVAPTNVHLQCLTHGPTGKPLDFRHRERMTGAMCDELGRTILRLCTVIPAGLIVFLPSYSYEAKLVRHWKQSGLWEDLLKSKRVHREPRHSSQIEVSLASYSKDAPTGALLFSVIGGKLSEGINFSNDLARGVVVVGLPYPDISDPELIEKMRSMDESSATGQNDSATLKSTAITGQMYYHNLCMRAVNQSVGRAIRHANDYAAIVLCDHRYAHNRVKKGLPEWLNRGSRDSHVPPSFPVAESRLTSFFVDDRASRVKKK